MSDLLRVMLYEKNFTGKYVLLMVVLNNFMDKYGIIYGLLNTLLIVLVFLGLEFIAMRSYRWITKTTN